MELSAAIPFDLIVAQPVADRGGSAEARLLAARRRRDARVPMLLIAEPEERDSILRGFDLGANDWLVLPLDENELRARARNQIRRKFYQDRLRTDLGTALEMALIDPLTGLYNQRYLMRHLRGLLESGPEPRTGRADDRRRSFQVGQRRVRPRRPGDKALRAIADVLRGNTRVFDSLARYGGEEFVVVMPGTEPSRRRAGGRTAARRGRSHAVHMGARRGTHRLTVSIGVACSAQHAEHARGAAARRRSRALRGEARRAQPGRDRRSRCRPARSTERYLILASLNGTCLRTTGSYFFISSLPVWVRAFFFVT